MGKARNLARMIADSSAGGTEAATMPIGTTAQRPATPQQGMFRMNSTTNEPEWYDSVNATWVQFAEHATYSAEYLAVAGGGGGGQSPSDSTYNYQGGGGGGGLLSTTVNLLSGTAYSVVVGAGGAVRTNGGNSQIGASIIAVGGGRGASGGSSGASDVQDPGDGGSGGGGANTAPWNTGANTKGNNANGGAGTSGQGYAGGSGFISGSAAGNGGGGAGGAGAMTPSSNAAAAGGAGSSKSITGSSVTYAAGGYAVNAGQLGGVVNGSAGTGNGGTSRGSGGSGIVVIRYFGPQRATGGTVTTSGGYTIHTFTSSGTFTA